MKSLIAVSLLLMGAHAARAQQGAPDYSSSIMPPGVSLLKLGWAAETLRPQQGGLSTNSTARSGSDLYTGGPSLPDVTRTAPRAKEGDPPGAYVYSVKVRNGGKAIKAAAFAYVFDDPANGSEMSRRQFHSFEKISRSETATLHGRATAPPSVTISVEALEREKVSGYKERVEFGCVIYADGARWKSPSAPESTCDYLSEQLRVYRKKGGR